MTRLVREDRASIARNGERQFFNTYQVEWNFIPDEDGGKWGVGWQVHTDLGAVTLTAAKAALEETRRGMTNKSYYRIVRTSRRVVAG